MSAAVLLLLGQPVAAHEAPSGWTYSAECCSSTDCSPVPDTAIREVQGGFSVELRPGEHPMLRPGHEPLTIFVPHGDPRIQPSGDGQKHACISMGGGYLYCLYLPPGGV
jgi:hypothetical protein